MTRTVKLPGKKLSIYDLHSNPIEFVEAARKKTRVDMVTFRILFIFLNICIALAAATMAILSALFFSLLIFGGKKPIWFFFAATGVSAITTMLTSFVNFFVVKGKYQEAMRRNKKIIGQVTLYINHAGFYKKDAKNRAMLLYTRVAQICGNSDAIGETSEDVKKMQQHLKKAKRRGKDD